MILREHYLQQIRPFYDSDLIKIITGIRRCGKSVIMQQVRDEIRAKSEEIVYLEFEKREVRTQLPDADSVLEYVKKRRKSGRSLAHSRRYSSRARQSGHSSSILSLNRSEWFISNLWQSSCRIT